MDRLRDIFWDCGAVAVGVSRAEPVADNHWQAFESWLDSGRSAGMEYMANHKAIRRDPRLLLDDARSVISLAFSFAPAIYRDSDKWMIACYAYGEDYHDVLRRRVREAVKEIKDIYGGEYRVCIDSAPILERYWAEKSGIGEIGKNGSLIVPGYGSMVFLCEVITTLELREKAFVRRNTQELKQSFERKQLRESRESREENEFCLGCGKCVAVCPGSAINGEGGIDARRCLSYLTIEHRGEWCSDEALETVGSEVGKKTLFGCDLCLRSCPLNKGLEPTRIEEFQPRPE
ncbi:MAG: DUF1730 domain-containing protein, partial [Muribaculaceae bacterium]|nr:DUF1730 domain-containing protein [Muribaculaceae bacterium]